jgi:hypothetical protein
MRVLFDMQPRRAAENAQLAVAQAQAAQDAAAAATAAGRAAEAVADQTHANLTAQLLAQDAALTQQRREFLTSQRASSVVAGSGGAWLITIRDRTRGGRQDGCARNDGCTP